ncbi:MAG: hypothetical protein QXJ96_00210 [Candidatus Aenigmatarchaeota archaeon]
MIKMVFGWIKSKIKREKEDEYERIRQSILLRTSEPSSPSHFEEEKPILLDRFRKDEIKREEPLEPWERERLEREGIKPEWKPFRERREEGITREKEFEPALPRKEEEPFRRKEIYESSLEPRAIEGYRGYEDMERMNNRLRFIEEQLATIKAQNEVLIEKLRSLERRLGYV